MRDIQRLATGIVGDALAGQNLNDLLSQTLAANPALVPQERGALQDLCFGALRHYGTLTAVLTHLAAKPVTDERVRNLLTVALYQLAFTRAKPYAIVDHAVESVSLLGFPQAKGLVNGVLRNFLRDPDGLLAIGRVSLSGRLNHPPWWIAKVQAQHPQDWERMLQVANQPPPMTLRVNGRKTTPEAVIAALGEQDMDATMLADGALVLARPVPVERVPGFADGLVSVQDASAQRAAPLLDLADGMRVLDACSAPGGKAGHILELAQVDLVAMDDDAKRLERVRANLDRLGLVAELKLADAGAPEAWWDGKPFDRVLIDAPCSGSGVTRRHPDIKWARREADTRSFALQQARLLDGLWKVLAVGGKLLYATCSVFHEENQQQIAAFLGRHVDATRLDLGHAVPESGQILPDDFHDGFFYALLAKA